MKTEETRQAAEKAEKKKIPRKIWVQWYGDGDPNDPMDPMLDEGVSWCDEKIHEHDVCYVTEESAVKAQVRNHQQGFREGFKAAGQAIATELAKL